MQGAKPKNIDEYLDSFPPKVRKLLQQVRKTIHNAAPKATEVISYSMPAFKMKRVLVYFAAYEHHIGFYPTGAGIAAFQGEIAGYKNSKGAVQFPIDEPLPLDLITKMVQYRVVQDEAL